MNPALFARTLPAVQRRAVCYVVAIRPEWTPPPFDDDPCDGDWEPPPPPRVPARKPRGEILRDASGKLYERQGELIRPLESLAVSPSGEIVEPTPQPAIPLLKALPGAEYKRLLPWGAWRTELAGQVACPDRLTAGVRLPCDITVFELTRPASPAEIQNEAKLLALDEGALRKLGLQGRFPASAGSAGEGGAWPAGSRFFSLKVAHDPTLAAPAPAVAPPPPVPRPAAVKTEPPARFQRPWEFQLSREEAITAMEREAAAGGKWRNRLILALRRGESEQSIQDWKVRLAGHTPEDQLWNVRPPRQCWHSAEVRECAARLLSLAGYPAPGMLREWEIFWRRKGV